MTRAEPVPSRTTQRLSPLSFLQLAAIFALLFLALSLFGLREYTTLMTGTAPDGGAVSAASGALAALYVASHLGAVVVAPVLALAAVLWSAYGWLRPRSTTATDSGISAGVS